MAVRASDVDPDEELMRAYVGGDPESFPRIVRSHYGPLLGHANRRLGDDAAAEDAVQETFLRAYRNLATFGGEYRLGAWLHTILANVCHDEDRRRNRERAAFEGWSAAAAVDAPPADASVADPVALRHVRDAIAALPAGYRQALMLRDVMDLDYGEIAAAEGISEDNARARVSRARSALRRVVDPAVARVVLIFGAFRRYGRATATTAHQLSTQPTATLTSMDVSIAPRVTAAISGIAVAVAATVPALTVSGGSPTAGPATPQPTIVVRSGSGAGSSTSLDNDYVASSVVAAGAGGSVVAEAPTSTTSTTLLHGLARADAPLVIWQPPESTTTTVPQVIEVPWSPGAGHKTPTNAEEGRLTAQLVMTPTQNGTAGGSSSSSTSSTTTPTTTSTTAASGSADPAPADQWSLSGGGQLRGLGSSAQSGTAGGVMRPDPSGTCGEQLWFTFAWDSPTGGDQIRFVGDVVQSADGSQSINGTFTVVAGADVPSIDSTGAFDGRLVPGSQGGAVLDAHLHPGISGNSCTAPASAA